MKIIWCEVSDRCIMFLETITSCVDFVLLSSFQTQLLTMFCPESSPPLTEKNGGFSGLLCVIYFVWIARSEALRSPPLPPLSPSLIFLCSSSLRPPFVRLKSFHTEI
jgi:hypothetical protein